jgi:hypothetical protein
MERAIAVNIISMISIIADYSMIDRLGIIKNGLLS